MHWLNFGGLAYAPTAERTAYFLLGLLWDHVPCQLAFEEFELNPLHQGYEHKKHLDGPARILRCPVGGPACWGADALV